MSHGLALDHLVIGAASLAEGVAWCEATLGITPGAGGRHTLMGTHNRLFSIESGVFPQAYAEILAIDPDAAPPARARWFDLDQPAVQQALRHGPALLHWVARAPDAAQQIERLKPFGLDGGEVVEAERDTPQGRLQWRIGLRADGRRLCGGALPTWITWGAVHPSQTLAGQGVRLERLALAGIPAQAVPHLPGGRGIDIAPTSAVPGLRAVLSTPRGDVVLHSPG